jgi:hypothetical protein
MQQGNEGNGFSREGVILARGKETVKLAKKLYQSMERFYYIVENGGFSRELLDLICDTAEVINNVDALVLRFEEELVDRDIKQVSEQ